MSFGRGATPRADDVAPPEWRRHARCASDEVWEISEEQDVDIWFPPKGPRATSVAKIAKQVCLGEGPYDTPCPVLYACREYAVVTNQKIGIWGGTSEQERSRIRRARRRMYIERRVTIIRSA